MKKSASFLAQSAVIAALYATLTLLPFGLSFDALQFRFAEALTILPFFTPAAIPGLAIGCVIANIWSRFGIIDVIFGSLATLLAALLTYYLSKVKFGRFFAPMPPVILNGLFVGALIAVATVPKTFNADIFIKTFIPFALSVGFGELVVCYGLGLPLLLVLDRYKYKIFKNN